MDSFGTRLRKIRNEKGLTLDEVSDATKITKATLSRYENGLRDPKGEIINILAAFFNVSVDYLMGKEDTAKEILADKIIKVLIDKGELLEGEEITEEKMDEIKRLLDKAYDIYKIQKRP